MPYLGKKKINEITAANIIAWENELLIGGYSQTYMKTVYNQLNAIFNYAVKYYDLRVNPCAKAGAIGKNKADEMNFWTKDEFLKFADCIAEISDIISRAAYITGFALENDIRKLEAEGLRIPRHVRIIELREWLGELMALTPADLDFVNKTLTVSKSYQRLGDRDVITPPKTPKSNRTISIPDFLCDLLKEY